MDVIGRMNLVLHCISLTTRPVQPTRAADVNICAMKKPETQNPRIGGQREAWDTLHDVKHPIRLSYQSGAKARHRRVSKVVKKSPLFVNRALLVFRNINNPSDGL